MNDTVAPQLKKTGSPVLQSDGRIWFYLAGFLLVSLLAVSRQSFWIDEGCAALKAREPALSGWWQAMLQIKGSDLQMPLYMFWLWICGHLFGTSELALRAVNIFWLAPGLLALLHALAAWPRMRLAVFLTAASSPFAWYYLNEARPYAMQLAAGLFLAAALCHWTHNTSAAGGESAWVWGFVAALVALAGASLLGMIWATVPVIAAALCLPNERLRRLVRGHIFAWSAALFLLGALGIYYLWTLKAGARAAAIASATNWKNLLFVPYELLGFSGLGPGRLALRGDAGVRVFLPYAAPLALYAVAVLVLLLFAAGRLLAADSRKKILGALLSAAVPSGFIFLCGVLLHFRVLGRHFAPLFPCTVLLLAFGMTAAWQRHWTGRIFVVLFLSLSLVSCLELRFGRRHAKDDYRSAAAAANAALADGKNVVWNASDCAAIYYHVPLSPLPGENHHACLVVNPTRDSLPAVGQVDVVIVSRPDIFDNGGAVAAFLKQNQFKVAENLPAFVIWEKTAGSTR